MHRAASLTCSADHLACIVTRSYTPETLQCSIEIRKPCFGSPLLLHERKTENCLLQGRWVLQNLYSCPTHVSVIYRVSRRHTGMYIQESQAVYSAKWSTKRPSVTVFFPSFCKVSRRRGTGSSECLRVTVVQIDLGLPSAPPMAGEKLSHPPASLLVIYVSDKNKAYSLWAGSLLGWMVCREVHELLPHRGCI